MGTARHLTLAIAAVAAALSAGCKPALKAGSVASPDAAETTTAGATPVFDADARDALQRMGLALHAQDVFSLTADITSEKALVSGQKLQFMSTLALQARRPGYFKLTTTSDHGQKQLYFNGKTLTLFTPGTGFYTSVPAPEAAGPALTLLKQKYGIETPLADLFYWGVDGAETSGITSGFHVGIETVDGHACDHYALRKAEVDWQVWIRTAGPALPCKLVITTTDDPSMPQYSAVLHWQPGTAPPEAAFTFAPPPGVHVIAIAEQAASPAS